MSLPRIRSASRAALSAAYKASLLLTAVTVASCSPGKKSAAPHERAQHVVLIVWDGMRPDFVTADNTPNLSKLAQEGVTFRNHHSVYPSVTNVNGTVFATGVYPGRSGVIANNEFRPSINSKDPVDTAVAETIRAGDAASGGHYLNAPTIPEILRQTGHRTAVAGTKWVAALFDRADRGADGAPAVTSGKALPEKTQRALYDSLGEFPERRLPNTRQDAWTTSALIDTCWKEGVPDFSLLWLSEPDYSAHDTAPGAPAMLAGVHESDAQFGRVLAALEAKQARAQTDLFIVSDHGFSTIERACDVPAMLREAGFSAATKFESEPEPGSILVVGNAGTALFYVTGHDDTVVRRLVEWLQRSEFAGVIFTREKIEGTFAMDEVHLAKPDGPDVIAAFRWNANQNQFGIPGLIMSDWNRAAGQGTHSTLSRFDLHNTLIAAGPDFRRGYTSDLPSGNIDIASTILRIFDITPPMPLDGRILSEAMSWGEAAPDMRTETVEATRQFGGPKWRQYLKTSTIDQHTYIDEGNGSLSASGPR